MLDSFINNSYPQKWRQNNKNNFHISFVVGEKLLVTIYNVWRMDGRYFPPSCIRFYAIQLPLYSHSVQSWVTRNRLGGATHRESPAACRIPARRQGTYGPVGGLPMSLRRVLCKPTGGLCVETVLVLGLCTTDTAQDKLRITLSSLAVFSAYRRCCFWVFCI